jgi:hypothetical protein
LVNSQTQEFSCKLKNQEVFRLFQPTCPPTAEPGFRIALDFQPFICNNPEILEVLLSLPLA